MTNKTNIKPYVVIEYRCPKCGGKVEVWTLLTYPPKDKYVCTKCGWSKVEDTRITTIEFKLHE